MASMTAQKRANVVVARLIPPILLGALIYVSYAITKPLCIDYLIYPTSSNNRGPRVGAGAAILTIYYVLLIPMLASYARLYHQVLRNPGTLPLGEMRLENDEKKRKEKNKQKSHWMHQWKNAPKADAEKGTQSDVDVERASPVIPSDSLKQSNFGLEDFYTKDVFVCREDGWPFWCDTCTQFKADRAHHCRELGRCVRKMDHFCPWVGGIVSETSYKFFIQFVFYSCITCGYILIVSAYFTAEIRRDTGAVSPYWCVAIGLSALFALFAGAMAGTSLLMSIDNLSTIENFDRYVVEWALAVRVPEHLIDRLWYPQNRNFQIVYFPPTVSSTNQSQSATPSTGQRHVFAILKTAMGENPFDLGSPFKNLQQVMGYSIIDWFLPIKPSPCADHSSMESQFALGPVVTRLRQQAGLLQLENGAVPTTPHLGRSQQDETPR